MSDEPSAAPEERNLEIDLAESFLPAWAKSSATSNLAEKYATDRPSERPFRDRPAGDFQRRKDRRPGKERRPPRSEGNRTEAGKRPHIPAVEEPRIEGWELRFAPEPRGMDGLVRQIRSSALAYSLFDLAQLILERPERYLAVFTKKASFATPLIQAQADQSLWLEQGEAITHLLSRHLDVYYRTESIAVDPPKGNYAFVAVCGLSQTVLGPPNHHDYQATLRKVHAEKFGHLSFEAYKSRIHMVKEEAVIQQWKDSQTRKEVFHPLSASESDTSEPLANLGDVERHFRRLHLASAVQEVAESVSLPGLVALQHSAPAVKRLVREHWENLKRFPLPLAHLLGQEFHAKGLQIFKAHENITYVAIARPRFLDRQNTPLASGLGMILDYLETHPGESRDVQWKALLQLRSGSVEAVTPEQESSLAKDLSWLLHEGYVTNYARKGLEITARPKSRTPQASPPPSPL